MIDAADNSGCTALEITQAAACLIANVVNHANLGEAAMRQIIEYTAEQIEAHVRLFAAIAATREGRQ
jgi:hypothetical protein